MLDLFTLLSAV